MSKGLEELKKARKPFDGSYLLNDEQYRVILNELQTLEILKKKLIFYFDDEAQSISIERKTTRLFTIINIIILCFDDIEEYGLLKEIFL